MSAYRSFVAAAAFSASMVFPAMAEAGFDEVKTKSEFMKIVDGKNLKILGITVNVTPAGYITGRAYGRDVSGKWQWSNGFFCRSLYWGKRDLGPNCQEVRVNGNTIRFTSDKGNGEFADLAIR